MGFGCASSSLPFSAFCLICCNSACKPIKVFSRFCCSSSRFVACYCETLSLTWPQVIPKRKVDTLSAIMVTSSAIVQKIHVLELPLRESFRSIVRDDSLYGGIEFLFLRASMHLPSVVKLWLILVASWAFKLVAPLLCTLSDPAKSTNKNFDFVTDLPVFLTQLS